MATKRKEQQPVIKLRFNTMDTVLLATNILIILFLWTYIITIYNELSATIPTHFGFDGKADATGPRSSLFLLPVIATVMSIMLWILSFYPHKFNYAVKITEANASHQYRLGVNLVRWLSVIITILFSYITYITISNAKGESQGLGAWFLHGFLALPTLLLIVYFILAGRRK